MRPDENCPTILVILSYKKMFQISPSGDYFTDTLSDIDGLVQERCNSIANALKL